MNAPAVLIVSPVPTHPTTAGNRVRIFRLAQAIEALGYSVEFAHVEREQGDADAMRAWWGHRYHPIPYNRDGLQPRALRTRFQRKIRNFLGKGLAIDAWYDSNIDHELGQLLAGHRFGTVIIEYVFLSKALLNVGPDVLKVIDTHDVFAYRNERFAKQGAGSRWFSTSVASETKGLGRADLVIAIQDKEAEHFRRTQSKPVVTIGDIIELPKLDPLMVPDKGSPEVLLVGSNNPSNVQAAQWLITKVLPLVNKRVPNVQWTIVGGVINSLDPSATVVLKDFVDSLAEHYQRAHVVVNPARVGTGLKIKTVEALSFAKAVVATQVGGEGLEDGWQSALKIADSAEEFARAIVELLEDSSSAALLGQEGQDYLKKMNKQSTERLAMLLAEPFH